MDMHVSAIMLDDRRVRNMIVAAAILLGLYCTVQVVYRFGYLSAAFDFQRMVSAAIGGRNEDAVKPSVADKLE